MGSLKVFQLIVAEKGRNMIPAFFTPTLPLHASSPYLTRALYKHSSICRYQVHHAIRATIQSTVPRNDAAADDLQPSPIESHQLARTTRVVIVPGKFESFHLGHKHLAETAAKYGNPTLLSFSGMFFALGWKPRPSVIAQVERDQILRSWSAAIGTSLSWKILSFSDVRNMTPRQFLQYLVTDFKASAIVCGSDWRFGKNRQGDIALLRQLAPDFNLDVMVVDPVIRRGHVVSSTRVRDALLDGDVELVSELLGRLHRVVGFTLKVDHQSVLCGEFVNMTPKDGIYDAIVRVIGRSEPIHTTVTVFSKDGVTLIRIRDAQHIYCAECEMYIDFVSKRIGNEY